LTDPAVELKKIFREIVLIVLVSSVLGAAVNFSLIRRFVRGELKQGFLAAEEFPGIRFIALQETEELFGRGQAVFVDSRSRDEFRAGHIPGSLSIPLEENKSGLDSERFPYPQDRTLVVYCQGGGCQTSIALAKLIFKLGFRDIRIFSGGFAEWSASCLPLETSR
jgi:rhodanese-related sulfurtransferase